MNPFFTMDVPVTRRYLRLPVRAGDPRLTARLVRDGQLAREFAIELAQAAERVDWWAFYDLGAFAGQTLRLEIGAYPPDPGADAAPAVSAATTAWWQQAIHLSDAALDAPDLYRERYRPQFHFTPRRGWNNDPNGLVYQDGEWHLFYQHNPFGTGWGNMHWGHAVSSDLLHWQELDEALYQRALSDMAFSGGGLVDHANSAGFQAGAEPPLVVAFTSTGRGECLAYSNDRGRTLVEWDGNPFLVHRGRDPKIIWYPPEQKWVLIVYDEPEGWPETPPGYALFDSPDLKRWRRLDFLPGLYECPELFSLPLDGRPEERRWVVLGYGWEGRRPTCRIGDFDGQRFTTREENEVSHYGPNFYAAQVFNNAPDGRVILLGWLSGAAYPGMPFSQGLTVPLELSLRSTPTGTRLCFNPVRELEALRVRSESGENLSLAEANRLLAGAGELVDLELALRLDGPLSLDVRGHPIQLDPGSGEIRFSGSAAPLPGADPLRLRVLVDRSVTEVFVDAGLAAFSALSLFDDPAGPIRLEGQGRVAEIAVHTLRSIWELKK